MVTTTQLFAHATEFELAAFGGAFLLGVCTGVVVTLLVGSKWFFRKP